MKTMMRKSKTRSWGSLLLALVFIFTSVLVPVASAASVNTTNSPDNIVNENHYDPGDWVYIWSESGSLTGDTPYTVKVTHPNGGEVEGFPSDYPDVITESDGTLTMTEIFQIPDGWPEKGPYKLTLINQTDRRDKVSSDNFSVNVAEVEPEIAITKTASDYEVAAGETVTYTYVVTNPGTVALSHVSVVDDKVNEVTYQSGDENGNDLLDPGETWTYTSSSVLTEDTTNIATATGRDKDQEATATADATVTIIDPSDPTTGSLTVKKVLHDWPGNPEDAPGFVIKLTGPSATEPPLEFNTDGLPYTEEGFVYTFEGLTPGEYQVTEPSLPKGWRMVGREEIPIEVLAGENVSVTITNDYCPCTSGDDPGTLKVTKVVMNAAGAVVDTAVSFAITIFGPGGHLDTQISNGETLTFTGLALGEYYVVEADTDDYTEDDSDRVTLTENLLTDEITLINTMKTGGGGGDPGDETNPAIKIDKQANLYVLPEDGGPVTYTYLVSNTGDVSLTDVNVTDDKIGGENPGTISYLSGDVNDDEILDLTETWVYEATADIDRTTTNTATVVGYDGEDDVTDTDKVTVRVRDDNGGGGGGGDNNDGDNNDGDDNDGGNGPDLEGIIVNPDPEVAAPDTSAPAEEILEPITVPVNQAAGPRGELPLTGGAAIPMTAIAAMLAGAAILLKRD